MSLRSKLGFGAKAGSTEFTPRSNIPRSDVQGAVEYIMDNAENVGTVYAPTDAEYLTNGAAAGLSNERAVTDTSTITWDFSTLGQAKANWAWMGIEDLTDPNADRGLFWDDSEGAFKFFTAGTGMGFSGTNLSITDADLVAIVGMSFTLGDILYHDGTTLQRLGAGTDGQFLRTRGTSTAPDWQNISGGGDMLRANNLSDLTSASTARTNLGVAIGTNVQAWDAQLDSLSSASANGVSLVTAANYAAMKALLDLEIGTDLQAWSTHLDSIAALARTDGNVIVGNGTTWVAESGSTARTSLGLGTGDSPTFTAVTVGNTGLTVGSSTPFSDAAGTLTLQNVDALDATTEATIEAAIDTLANLTSIQGVSFTFGAYAPTLLNNANEAAFKQAVNLEIGVDVQAYSSILANTTASFTTADETKVDYLTVTGATDLDTIRTKVGHITITQAVDLDAIETRVNQLDASVVLSGTWDASAGTFPGGGTAQAGQSYIVSIGGTVDGVAFTANDRIVAILDNASTTTYASNWHKLDYTDAVLSVAGRTGAVTLAVADITDMSANGRSLVSAADYAAMKALLDLEIGTDVQAYDADLTTLGGLSKTDGNFIVADGAAWTVESGSTARASLGLTIGTHVQAYSANLSATGSTTIKLVGAETIWVPAKAMTARTTNGAASGTTESTTNDVIYPTFDFDQSTEEGVGFWIAMPKSWNESTVTFIPYWTAASGSGGVVFAINAYAFSNDDAIDTAPSGQQTSTDTLIATGDIHVGPESSAITIGGTPAEGDIVYFQITREVGDGSDTLSGDAKLIGVKVIFTTNAATDA